MHWWLVFCVIWLSASITNGQRRAIVYYSLTSPEEVEPVSENPLSSSINSIQTGREELIAYHRGDIGLGGALRRGNQKTTTPDYFKESIAKADISNTGKPLYVLTTKPTVVDTKAAEDASSNPNSGRVEGPETYKAPTNTRSGGDTPLPKDKRSSGFETPSPSSSIRSGSNPNPVRSPVERSSEKKDEAKGSMEIVNKGAASRDQDRRRQITTPSSSSSSRFNTSVRDSSERHREELSDKNQNDRLNRERRPTVSTETRGHRTATRSASDKSQILTQTPPPRIPVQTGAHDRTAQDRPLDSRDSSFRNADEKKKGLNGEPELQDKVYETGTKDRANSTVINKPTHLLIGEERVVEASKSPDVYRDEFRGGSKDDSNEKVRSDTEKSFGGGDGKIYADRPYMGDGEERSPSNQGRGDRDRDYIRRQRDRYDDRSYDERPLKDRQAPRDRERNATYYSQDRTGSRSSRPRDRGYDEEYEDDVYSPRDATKDADIIPKGRTRATVRRPYTRTDDEEEERDRYAGDGTRSYRDYPDDRRYRDESASADRDSTRRYRDEDRKYRDNGSRTYDDYEYRDRYNRRYESDGETRRYGDNVTRRYGSNGSRRYEDDDTEYDRTVRRYKDDDEYPYNNTQRYRDSYDGYRGDNRRSSGESGSPRRYDETDGTRSSRYDDEEYVGGRGYRDRDGDRKYVRSDDEDGLRQRDATRKYAADDPRYREADGDRRYRDEARVYSESSLKDRYDQESRRTLEGDGSTYTGTRPYQERSETSARRDYDDVSRRRGSDGSQRSRGDENYRSYPYAEDEYYNNRSSTGYVDRYDESDRSKGRTDDDSLGSAASVGESPKYVPRSSEERRRDRDRVYADVPVTRSRTDADYTRRDKGSRVYDEDRYSDRSRTDTYDERTSYRGRDDDEYVRSSRDRVRDYDAPVYRDSDDEVDSRSRVRGDSDVIDRYKGDDTVRDRITDDEYRKSRPVGGRNRDKGYIDRRYDDEYRDKGSDGTYRYREEDEKYRNPPVDDRKPENRDSERRNRGTQRSRDDYDTSYDKDYSIPRSADERPRGGDRSTRREDRFAGDRADFDDRALARPPRKIDTAVVGDVKSELSGPRNDESALKTDRSIPVPYDEERRRDGVRSPPRDVPPVVRIPGTQYTPNSDKLPPKPPRVRDDTVDVLDKGDFARGRRTSFYNEDDKADSDRDAGSKGARDDRRLPRTGDKEDLPYTRDEKSRGPVYDPRDLRQSDRPSLSPNAEGRIYSNKRESSDATRYKTKDEIPVSSGVPSDLVPSSGDRVYPGRTEDIAKSEISQGSDGTQRRRYPSASYDRGTRRRLPNVRDPETDRAPRRDEYDDSVLPENRGRYRYTKSRGDPEDFDRRPDEESFAGGDEYISRGTSSKAHDADRRDTLKGEYGSPGTPTRNKEDRVPIYPGRQDKEEFYPSSRDKAPPQRDGKPVDDARVQREFDRRDKVPRDGDKVGRDERGMYENGEYPRSSPQDEMKFKGENTTRDHFESSDGEVRVKKENDPNSPVVSHAVPGARGQSSSISRSATPIPHSQDKEFINRNPSSKNISDRFAATSVNREKRFQYDDRPSTHNTSRIVTSVNDELSKRPLTTKEVIEAAYRHSEEPVKSGEIFYPVYVPGSSNLTSPDVIRPSERRGLTTPTKKKKKKCKSTPLLGTVTALFQNSEKTKLGNGTSE